MKSKDEKLLSEAYESIKISRQKFNESSEVPGDGYFDDEDNVSNVENVESVLYAFVGDYMAAYASDWEEDYLRDLVSGALEIIQKFGLDANKFHLNDYLK
jgi:hypothetical protein